MVFCEEFHALFGDFQLCDASYGFLPPPLLPPPPRLLYMGNEKRLLFKYCMRKNCFLEFIYFFIGVCSASLPAS